MKQGRLIVFEGPDGAGKTSLQRCVHRSLSSEPTRCLAFPGKESGSLGKIVYDIHHGTLEGVDQPSEASLQLLHIAAHLDAIDRFIRPTIRSGTSVLLDRYWWSTWTYGAEAGVGLRLLDRMIEVEKMYWGDLAPDMAFLLVPPHPYRAEIQIQKYLRLSTLYRKIAARADFPVAVIDEPTTREELTTRVVARLSTSPTSNGSDCE